jgi:hypothetical protein
MKLDELEKLAKAATPGRWPNYNDADIREQLWRQYDWDKNRSSRSPISIPYSDAEFIAAANPENVLKLIAVARAADDLADSVSPIINLDCDSGGTCKDCLEDGRGTHTEQSDYNLQRLVKALAELEAGDGD